jgi:hypothetical protein
MATTLTTPLTIYPTMSQAAALLGVSASTLSRRQDLACERMGERDKRVPVAEVLRLAAIYRKRSINEVAADLLRHVRERDPSHIEQVEEEIERFFVQLAAPAASADRFLSEAKRALPEKLYLEVERVYRDGGQRSADLVSAG